MSSETRETQRWVDLWKYLFGGACALLVLVAGVAVGVWARGLERSVEEVQRGQLALYRVLEGRADLPGRLVELEKRSDDQEARLRALEHGHKR